MRKYRTKAGTVEEKLPGVNATVNPSEKVQIAMAGGADTLKTVRDILNRPGKRNFLKNQGAKHIVSFYMGEGGYMGSDDISDSGFAPSDIGDSYSPPAADPVGDGTASPGNPWGINPTRPTTISPVIVEKGKAPLSDWQRSDLSIAKHQREIQSILLDPDRDMTIPTDEESEKARKSNLEQAYSDRLRAYTVNVLDVPLDKEDLIKQTVGELRGVQKAEKASWVSKVSAVPGPKGGIKAEDDYSKLGWMALGLVPPALAAVGVPAALTTVADIAMTAKQLQEGWKSYNAPPGISLKDREGNVIPGKEFPTEKMIEESIYGKPPAPPTTPDYSGDGDDAPKKKKKLFRSASNNVTLNIPEEEDFTRKQLRRAQRQITRRA